MLLELLFLCFSFFFFGGGGGEGFSKVGSLSGVLFIRVPYIEGP